MADLAEIEQKFAHSSPRPGQLEAIQLVMKAFDSGKRFVFLEGPVGSGKSVIGLTVSEFFQRSYYITIQKILQSQLVAEFSQSETLSSPLVDLKGRSNYDCTYWQIFGPQLRAAGKLDDEGLQKRISLKLRCDDGFCNRKFGKSRCSSCFPPRGEDAPSPDEFLHKYGVEASTCPYYEQVHKAVQADKTLLNFSSFLYQTNYTGGRFGERDLLIIDECLHPHTYVQTERGLIAIGVLVNKQMKVRVASFNKETGLVEYKPIKRWLKRPKQSTYRVLAGNRVFYPTSDHKIYTPSGTKRMSELAIGDEVLVRLPEITADQEQLVLGSLLGDASLSVVRSKRKSSQVNKGTRGRVKFRHGPKQYKYLLWKFKLMRPHAKTKPVLKPSAGFTKTTASFSTSCDFYATFESALIGGRKSPNAKWLDKINTLGLAVWFMDDGGLSGGSVRFNTHGFSRRECLILSKWLLSKWGLASSVRNARKRGKLLHYLQVGRDHTRILLQLIAKHIPPCMRYKLGVFKPFDPKTGFLYNFNNKSWNLWKAKPPLDGRYATAWEPYDKSVEVQSCKEVSIRRITLIEPYQESFTYDLEVEGNHNYFAGNTLVSNCHNSESQLMDFITVSFTDREFADRNLTLPNLELAADYAAWFMDNEVIELLSEMQKEAEEARNSKRADELDGIIAKIRRFVNCVADGMVEWVHEHFVHQNDYGTYHSVTIKPIFVHSFSEDLLFRYGKKVLLMSATILDAAVMADSLGIPKSELAFIRLPNQFPVENRPIFCTGSYKATGGKQKQHIWGPAMVKAVDLISRTYAGKRGIIHTHNFSISKMLMDDCESRKRFTYQMNYESKDEMLRDHARRPDSIIVAPAMHEGLDLKDELSRFQIIAKIPFPNFFDDKQLAIRVELDRRYLTWLTAIKIVQSYGRSIRSSKDYAHTYILDDFTRFYGDAKVMLPTWFRDALKRLDGKKF